MWQGCALLMAFYCVRGERGREGVRDWFAVVRLGNCEVQHGSAWLVWRAVQ